MQGKVHIALLRREQIGHIVFLPEQKEIPISHRHRAVLHGILERQRQIVLRVGSTPTPPHQGGVAHGFVQNLIDRGVSLSIDLVLLNAVGGHRI